MPHRRKLTYERPEDMPKEVVNEIALCGVPELAQVGDRPLIGGGNWPGCHGVGDFHSATVAFNMVGCPSHVRPHMEEIWRRVVAAYREIGLLLVRDDNNPRPNIAASWVPQSDGWIGLAIVGSGQGCSDSIWCRYLASYRGGNTDEQIINQWTTLILHEIGHNCGLSHTSGGIMNPSLINGLPPSWAGDPSERTLRRWYGGQPVPQPPTGGDDVFGILKPVITFILQALLRWIEGGGLESLDARLNAQAQEQTPPEKAETVDKSPRKR